MDATKDRAGEPTSRNPIQSVAEFVRKNIEPFKKTYMVLGMDFPKFVDHIF